MKREYKVDSAEIICRVIDVTSGDTMPSIRRFDSNRAGMEVPVIVISWSKRALKGSRVTCTITMIYVCQPLFRIRRDPV